MTRYRNLSRNITEQGSLSCKLILSTLFVCVISISLTSMSSTAFGSSSQPDDQVANPIHNAFPFKPYIDRDKLSEFKKQNEREIQDAIKQHEFDHPPIYRSRKQLASSKCPHPKRCNFRWTDPQTGTKWCCPNNNGFDKWCGRSYKGDAKTGCYWSFGCCEDD